MLLSWGATFRIVFFQFQDGRGCADEVFQGIAVLFLFGAVGEGQGPGPPLELFDQFPALFQQEHILFKINGSGELSVFPYGVGGVEHIVLPAVHGLVPAEPVPDFLLFPDAGQGGAFFLGDVHNVQECPAFIGGPFRDAHGLPGLFVQIDGPALGTVDVDPLFQEVQGLFQQTDVGCHGALLLCAFILCTCMKILHIFLQYGLFFQKWQGMEKKKEMDSV